MLGGVTSDIQVGIYDNSQKTIKLLLTISKSLGTVMLPAMSNLFHNGETEQFRNKTYKAFKFVNFISITMVLGLSAITNRFEPWFYVSSFHGVEPLIQIGSIIILTISWSNVFGVYKPIIESFIMYIVNNIYGENITY